MLEIFRPLHLKLLRHSAPKTHIHPPRTHKLKLKDLFFFSSNLRNRSEMNEWNFCSREKYLLPLSALRPWASHKTYAQNMPLFYRLQGYFRSMTRFRCLIVVFNELAPSDLVELPENMNMQCFVAFCIACFVLVAGFEERAVSAYLCISSNFLKYSVLVPEWHLRSRTSRRR